MRRTALVLVTALVLGAGAGLFVHDGTARESDQAVSAAWPPSASSSLPGLLPLRPVRRAQPQTVLRPPRISIPRLQVESRVFAPAALNRGPAWWPVTGRPGGGDTIAVAGHRTTHTRPFYYLEQLRPGDRIYVSYRNRTYRYRVSESRVVSAEDLHIADAVGHERLLLTACTPRGSARYRLVVEADPV